MRPRPTLSLLLCTALLLAFGGCASEPVSAPKPAAPAHLAITNLSAYSWRIAVVSGDVAVETARVEKYGTAELNLAGGDYVIEQALLDGDAATPAVRRFAARFEAGQTYRWSLATLRSVVADIPPHATLPTEPAARE